MSEQWKRIEMDRVAEANAILKAESDAQGAYNAARGAAYEAQKAADAAKAVLDVVKAMKERLTAACAVADAKEG